MEKPFSLDGALWHRRPTWDEYFLLIAQAVATRSDCVRDKVGAVIVVRNRIIATGYNGAPAGEPGCAEAPCPRSCSGVPRETDYDHGAGRCIAFHAEVNAMYQCGVAACEDATLYSTRVPCPACGSLVRSARFARVVYLRHGVVTEDERSATD